MNNTEELYKVTSMQFKGEDSVGHYNYLLSFNKSLVHTGNLGKIEDGLNNKTNQILQELKEKVERCKSFRESYFQGLEKEDVGYDFVRGELSMVEEIITLIDEAMS